jgi:hypothetical protein
MLIRVAGNFYGQRAAIASSFDHPAVPLFAVKSLQPTQVLDLAWPSFNQMVDLCRTQAHIQPRGKTRPASARRMSI